MFPRRFFRPALLAAAGVAAFAVFAGPSVAARNAHTVPSGVRIAGIRVGGLTPAAATPRVEDRLRQAAPARPRRYEGRAAPGEARERLHRSRRWQGALGLERNEHPSRRRRARRRGQGRRREARGEVRPQAAERRHSRSSQAGRGSGPSSTAASLDQAGAAPARRPRAHRQLAAPDLAEDAEDLAVGHRGEHRPDDPDQPVDQPPHPVPQRQHRLARVQRRHRASRSTRRRRAASRSSSSG